MTAVSSVVAPVVRENRVSVFSLFGLIGNSGNMSVSSTWLPMQELEDDYNVDAKEFLEHSDRVVFVRRMPAWISTDSLGTQVTT